MKKALVLLSGLLLTAPVFAQQTTTPKPMKNIEVIGTSEIEETPDELYFNINLREFFKDEKNQRDKVTIDGLEKQLIAAVAAVGLPKANLSISGVSGYRNYQWPKPKKPAVFLERKEYVLKVADARRLDDLLAKVDERGIESVYMGRTERSDKEEIKKRVKVQAVKAAREKAALLAEALGQQLGEPIEVQEVDEGYVQPRPMMQYRTMAMAKNADAAAMGGESDLEYQKMKFSSRIRVVFAMK